jgi:hypothetical protein
MLFVACCYSIKFEIWVYMYIGLTGLLKLIVCIVNGIMISKCPTMDFNGIVEFKLCINDKSILNVCLLFFVLHYVLVSRKILL